MRIGAWYQTLEDGGSAMDRETSENAIALQLLPGVVDAHEGVR